MDKTQNVEFNYTDLCAFAEMASQEMRKPLASKVSVIYNTYFLQITKSLYFQSAVEQIQIVRQFKRVLTENVSTPALTPNAESMPSAEQIQTTRHVVIAQKTSEATLFCDVKDQNAFPMMSVRTT